MFCEKKKKKRKICIDKWLFKTFTGWKVENENQHIFNLYGVRLETLRK